MNNVEKVYNFITVVDLIDLTTEEKKLLLINNMEYVIHNIDNDTYISVNEYLKKYDKEFYNKYKVLFE
jgi:hypothetical protein